MSEITFHSDGFRQQPAINVKDTGNWQLYQRLTEEYGEEEFALAYEIAQGEFWGHYAPGIAANYDYGDVYSEGRSDGWLVVENPPGLEGDSEDMVENDTISLDNEVEKWLTFEKDIQTEIEYLCTSRIEEILAENRAEVEAEESEKKQMESRGIITVD